MENLTNESMYLELCNEFRAVIRATKAAFYRSDYQKLLRCSLMKTLGRAFKTLGRASEDLGEN